MIRFKIVGGEFLDLKSGTEIQFQYNNSTLAIGNVKLSRSTEFMIPKTPENERRLLFSSEIAGKGAMMRRKVQVEAHHSSGGFIKGHLSLKSYSKNEYSAIFVYGELEALRKTLELGNMSTYLATSDTLTTSAGRATTSAYYANGKLANNFDFYRYKNDVPAASRFATTVNMSPTVKLRYLLQLCSNYTGITLDNSFNSDAINSMGILLKGQNGGSSYGTVNFVNSPSPSATFSGDGLSFFYISDFKTQYYIEGEPILVNLRALRANKDIEIYFPSDINNCALVINNAVVSDVTGNTMTIKAGSRYKLSANDSIYFADAANYYFGQLIAPFTTLTSKSLRVKSYAVNTVELGLVYPLQSNLPEITFNDLLKTTAGIMLSGLGFDESTNTLSLFDFNYDKANSIELDGMLIEIESVDRTFINYARKNQIRFKSEDYVVNESTIVYDIDNDNLSENNTIYTIQLNDANKGVSAAEIKDFTYENAWKKTAKSDTIVIASKTGENLDHISRIYENFPYILNSKLKAIIQNSTTVKVKLRMYLFQFLAINYRTTFKYRGIHYTIYEATFSNEIVSATLIVV